jgi:hypothetical protein
LIIFSGLEINQYFKMTRKTDFNKIFRFGGSRVLILIFFILLISISACASQHKFKKHKPVPCPCEKENKR